MQVALKNQVKKGIITSYVAEATVFGTVWCICKALGVKSVFLIAAPVAAAISWPILIYFVVSSRKKAKMG
ncbi:MAG: hypothetical protein Q8R25_03610 [bacterium]|nr:hypothetical protein [bacterium]